MALFCSNSLDNIGKSSCKKNMGLPRQFVTTPSDFTITSTDIITSAAWQTAIKADSASRVYLWPLGVSYENVSSDETREDTPISSLKVFPGQHRFRIFFKENFEQHKAMYSHDGFGGNVFVIDHLNQIFGTSDDGGTTIRGFTLDELDVAKLIPNDGSVATKTQVTAYMTTNKELDQNGEAFDVSSFWSSLVPLTSVQLAVTAGTTPTASEVSIDVTSVLDGVGVSGLVQADFNLTGIGGTPSGVAETPAGSGTYVISGATFTSGDIDLVTADQLSIDAYESTGAVSVTI